MRERPGWEWRASRTDTKRSIEFLANAPKHPTMSFNRVTELPALPEHLEHLDCGDSRIEELPPLACSRLPAVNHIGKSTKLLTATPKLRLKIPTMNRKRLIAAVCGPPDMVVFPHDIFLFRLVKTGADAAGPDSGGDAEASTERAASRLVDPLITSTEGLENCTQLSRLSGNSTPGQEEFVNAYILDGHRHRTQKYKQLHECAKRVSPTAYTRLFSVPRRYRIWPGSYGFRLYMTRAALAAEHKEVTIGEGGEVVCAPGYEVRTAVAPAFSALGVANDISLFSSPGAQGQVIAASAMVILDFMMDHEDARLCEELNLRLFPALREKVTMKKTYKTRMNAAQAWVSQKFEQVQPPPRAIPTVSDGMYETGPGDGSGPPCV